MAATYFRPPGTTHVLSLARGSALVLRFGMVPRDLRVPRRGTYAPGVYICPHCGDDDFKSRSRSGEAHRTLGFAKWSRPHGDETVVQKECSACFEPYFHHCRRSGYYTYAEFIRYQRERADAG